MELRPALIDSKIARNALPVGAQSASEIQRVMTAIDRIGGLYDALRAASEARSPHETVEALAMRYEKQYSKCVSRAKEVTADAIASLEAYGDAARAAAISQTGLRQPPDNAQEIRSALRQMSQEDRGRAVERAFKDHDIEILASIYEQNAVTWGGVDAPIDVQFNLMVEQASPEVVQAREACDVAFESLKFAADAFAESASKWRDPIAAERGRLQQQEFEKAEAAIEAATSD